ncbi:MAG: substrate-binding domain-containing protein [Yersiniaceae bacterium]|nr:substrate-binding domain-containing protein [Yersiniaceae bacterium]
MSLKALARELGLSVTTVSRALNGYDDVAAATKQRVDAAAQRMGYRPNTLARRLKMGKIDAVGLLFPFEPRPLNNSAFIEMVGCISHELARQEIDLLLVAEEQEPAGMARLIESKRVDALLVAHTQPDDPRLQVLQQIGFPFLALGRSALPQPYAWFDFDNHAGTLLAVDHLVSLGHRRIAYLGETSPQTFVGQRRQGFLDGLRAHHLPLPPGYLGQILPTRRAGYQATRALLALPEPPTALITDNNMHGEGAVMALHEAGLLESGRVSLVIYDGLPPDSLIDLPITAVTQATREAVGRQIAEMTLALIRGEPLSELQVLWQPGLQPGISSHPPR